MKSRIGTINKKPIVQGDKNLVTPNEIHVSELKRGEQSNIPVEYYKVVVPEGMNPEEINGGILDILAHYPCFHTLIKGTSSSSKFTKFAGIPALNALSLENLSILAYAIRSFKVTGKAISYDYTVTELPSFNNIFDAIESLGEGGTEIVQLVKTYLVPITAEEFYNLDDFS